MIYAVNVDAGADLPAVLGALSALGNVSQPFPSTPRYIHLDGPDGLGPQIDAIAGVCGCCDAETPVTLTLIESQSPGFWHIGDISGNPQSEYGRDTGQFYLADVPPNTALIADCELIYNPSNGSGDHGTGTADTARRVWPHARIYASECFAPNGAGTVATVNAGLDAIATHRENSGWAGTAVCNCSFTSTGSTNPYQAVMDRMAALGVLIVASTGNEGINIASSPRWPANAADYSVGAVGPDHIRAGWSNYPADVYAGGSGVNFLLADGTYATGQGGTSISAPVFAMALRRALDEGHDGAWLLAQSRLIASNVPSGGNAVLTYPTLEASPPPPPPPTQDLGDSIMQIGHVGSPQTIPNAVNTDVAWETSVGVFQTEITIPAGWSVARAHVNTMTKSLPIGKRIWIYVTNASGIPVAGGRKSFEGFGATELYFGVSTLAFAVAEGETYKVRVWHDGGAGVKVNERGDAQLGFELAKIA